MKNMYDEKTKAVTKKAFIDGYLIGWGKGVLHEGIDHITSWNVWYEDMAKNKGEKK